MTLHEPCDCSKMPDGGAYKDQPKWRQDFPVDVGQDEYVARRDFVKFLGLISGAFALGQLWIALQSGLRRNRVAPPPKALASLADVPVGSAISFHYPDTHDSCVLVRPDEDTLCAFGQKCTHLSCAVLPDLKKRSFICPCHEGSFDMLSGRPTGGPPRRPLPLITLEVREGVIYATGTELRT